MVSSEVVCALKPLTLSLGLLALGVAPAVAADLTQVLLAQEQRIYQGWRDKSVEPLRSVLGEGAVAWGGYGALGRDEQLAQQARANNVCDVKSFGFRDAHVVRAARDAAVLYYTLQQDAVCGGGHAPSPLASTSVYALRGGRWRNVFRTSTPLLASP